MNQYRVVYVEPGKPAVEKKIGTKLEDLQAEVGGLIECIYCHRDGTLIVANDEAKLLGMEGNRRLDGGSVIAGPFFVIGDAGENFRSLTVRRLAGICKCTRNPSRFPSGKFGRTWV